MKKKKVKREVGRPTKNVIEPIPDTPRNVARSLFGLKSNNPRFKSKKDKGSSAVE